MAAPKGNQYARKWNLPQIEKLVNEIHQYVKENDKEYYVGTILANFGYDRHILNNLTMVVEKPIGCTEEEETKETKERREEVLSTIKKIDGIMEARLVQTALKQKSSVPLTIFLLKNRGYSDKQEHDHTTNGKDINLKPLQVQIFNSNPKVEFDEEGNIIRDETSNFDED